MQAVLTQRLLGIPGSADMVSTQSCNRWGLQDSRGVLSPWNVIPIQRRGPWWMVQLWMISIQEDSIFQKLEKEQMSIDRPRQEA